MRLDNSMALNQLKDLIVTHDKKGNALYLFDAVINLQYYNISINETHQCEIVNVIGFEEISFQINSESYNINSQKFHSQFSSNFSVMNFDTENKKFTITDKSPKIGEYVLNIIPIVS